MSYGLCETAPRIAIPFLLGRHVRIPRILQRSSAVRASARRFYKMSLCASGDAQLDCEQLDGTNDFNPQLKVGDGMNRFHVLPKSLDDDSCLGTGLCSVTKRVQIFSVASVFPRCTKISAKESFLVNMIKPTILTGLFILQDNDHALASTNAVAIGQSFAWFGDVGDISTGFTSAFLLILFSELGDKTFFIAALLASQKASTAVFIGTFGALTIMTVLSVLLGRTFHYLDGILPFRPGEMEIPIDDLVAAGLLVYFGVSTLLDASSQDNKEMNEEQEEAELAIAGFSGDGAGILATANTIISTFTLVFLAEWGDKSFFSTIALAASSSPLGVVGGAVVGHGVATLIAVLGGSLLGKYIPEKAVAYTGGVLFLVFAATTLIDIFT